MPYRAIFIDAKAHTITEIEVTDQRHGLADLQRLVGGSIERAMVMPIALSDDLFVNEEGLYKFNYGFAVVSGHQPFAGNGVIIGSTKSGDTADATSKLD